MPLAVGTIVQITYRSEYQSQRYMLTHHYRISQTTSTQDTDSDTGSIAIFFTNTGPNEFATKYRECLSTDTTIREVVAQPVFPQRLVQRSVNVAYSGTGQGTASTGNIAAIITLRTQFAGRSQVSNKHIGPLATLDIGAGLTGGALQTALNELGDVMDQGIAIPADGANTITLIPVIFHKGTGLHDVIVSHLFSTRLGTMRRRTLRVGE